MKKFILLIMAAMNVFLINAKEIFDQDAITFDDCNQANTYCSNICLKADKTWQQFSNNNEFKQGFGNKRVNVDYCACKNEITGAVEYKVADPNTSFESLSSREIENICNSICMPNSWDKNNTQGHKSEEKLVGFCECQDIRSKYRI